MDYPKKVLLYTLSDGTPVYETVESQEEYDSLCEKIEESHRYVRNYFKQYCP